MTLSMIKETNRLGTHSFSYKTSGGQFLSEKALLLPLVAQNIFKTKRLQTCWGMLHNMVESPLVPPRGKKG